jgi:HD superfamily phosphodiesterase
MSRLSQVRELVHARLNTMPDPSRRDSAVIHLSGVSLAAVMIARKRGMDPELPAAAAMLHDMAAYLSGSYDDHAHRGAELAKGFLQELGCFDAEETEIICSMIWHHDDKDVIDSPYDEVLKDADVIHHCFYDPSKPVKAKELKRCEELSREFDLK